ncbi:hydroxymethylglutaryl-CoA reductase, degradative [Cereibacter sphaeroides]|nr:hydroxymethylglutaryl-CoA reductase, degradative [Cereibacter sphaeroides]
MEPKPQTPRVRSRIENMRNMEPAERRAAVCRAAGLADSDDAILQGAGALPLTMANGMIENVVGTFELPLGVATNFVVNGKEYLVPMAVEEPSVVAAASYMAKLVAQDGGFRARADRPVMRAQIQVLGLSDPFGAKQRIFEHREALIEKANSRDKVLTGLGGGCRDLEVHIFEDTPGGPMLVLHILVDVRDAMGANTVNTMAEMLAPEVEKITGGTVRLRILSNLADLRVVRARAELRPETLGTDSLDGAAVCKGIVEACALAIVDPYRAATHNKGIMNGIDPVVVATGNDWRAIEAGAHAYAARGGRYTSLTRWEMAADGRLIGSIELPMALGIVGGATRTHPAAQAALRMMKVESASELAEVTAAVGLAQNMAAIRALATEGIQRGHMTLHARNIAITAGATGAEVDRIAKGLVAAGDISVDKARALLAGA